MPNQPVESDIQADVSQAARLYQRGVAAARAGQRRLAVGLLTRSVKLDPHNEGAWLWLSGVLDDPHQIGFCLNSVLKLNPENKRAQQGLQWLQERQLLRGQPAATSLPDVPMEDAARPRVSREASDSWWVNWRQWHRDTRRASVLLWSIPVIILALTLAIHQSFVIAVERNSQIPVVPTAAALSLAMVTDLLPPPQAHTGPVPTISPILEAAPHSIQESRTIVYLSEIEPVRQQLREAVDMYRIATGKPGGVLSHIGSAQEFQNKVREAYEKLQAIKPPAELQSAHDEYIKGLEVELSAIDDLLEFYGSYRVELANRAALRFQQADSHFENARTMFNARLQQIRQSTTISPHTVR